MAIQTQNAPLLLVFLVFVLPPPCPLLSRTSKSGRRRRRRRRVPGPPPRPRRSSPCWPLRPVPPPQLQQPPPGSPPPPHPLTPLLLDAVESKRRTCRTQQYFTRLIKDVNIGALLGLPLGLPFGTCPLGGHGRGWSPTLRTGPRRAENPPTPWGRRRAARFRQTPLCGGFTGACAVSLTLALASRSLTSFDCS